MNPPGHDDLALRRILVAFDPATAHRAAVEAVVDLAARLDAELEALFVEDTNLLRLAELPFVRQFNHRGGGGRPLDPAVVEAELRALAAAAERRVAVAATARRIRWSFRRARGALPGEVAAAAAEASLIVLETSSRPLGSLPRLASAARLVVERTTGPVLLLPPDAAIGPPVSLVYQGAAASRRAALTAAQLAARYGVAPDLLLPAATPAEAESWLQECAELLRPLALGAAHRRLAGPGGQQFDRLVRSAAGGILVVDALTALLEPRRFWASLAAARCSVLLMR